MILFSIVSIARWWFFPPGFTNLIDQKLSPDGKIVAAYVVENYGGMTGTTYGLTLSAAGTNVLQGQPILTEGEDDAAIAYRWLSDDALLVRLPCGWWGSLTNAYQLRGTGHVVAIFYTPPRVDCRANDSKRGGLRALG